MPSAYTQPVADGTVTTLPAFAMLCARAFGAMIDMRDEPLDAEVPKGFKPSSYYADQVEALEKELATLKQRTAVQALEFGHARLDERRANWDKERQRNWEKKERYEHMMNLVEQWNPPTPDHAGLRDYMMDQLRQSKQFDCSDTDPSSPDEVWTPGEMFSEEVARVSASLAYHKKARQEEIDRVKQRNQWLADLRASLAAFEAKQP
jgi:hypothetical protein